MSSNRKATDYGPCRFAAVRQAKVRGRDVASLCHDMTKPLI